MNQWKDKVAAKVFNGIQADTFWLLPQADFKPMFQLRVNSILDANDPLSTEEMLNQKYAGQNHDN